MKEWYKVVFAVAKAAGIFLLPSPIATLFELESDRPSSCHREARKTAYLDGLRGLAATIVFIEHFGLPFYPSIVGSNASEWSYLQLPIIRLLYHGSFAVSVFFVISGFVLSQNLIHLEHQTIDCGCSRSETPDRTVLASQILDVLGSAAFRRAPRLFLPSAVVVLLTAGLAFFFDAFAAAEQFPGLPHHLYRLDVPRGLSTLGTQLIDCFDFFLSQLIYPFPWMLEIPRQNGSNPPQTYGFHLWAIPVEFWASEMLFIVLMATSLRRRYVRPIVILLASAYSAWCGRWEPPLFFAGAQLAELDLWLQLAEDRCSTSVQCAGPSSLYTLFNTPNSRACLGTFMCIAGLWVGSIPDYKAASTFGFITLANSSTVPNSQVYWQGIGAVLFVWSLQYHRWLRRFFNIGLLQYLGQISFALYLVHVPIITTFGWAVARFLVNMYGKSLDDPGWDREVLIAVGGVLTFAAATWIADIFWRAFDSRAATLSKCLELLTRI
ncbi:hypothetical protein KVR01_013594 [Diaporthe batatas]|uniref:uncharacterized protein n=1 Tax=Diaporthe batatas TaxID=748121 RepID=UPI001D045768|nr:uncharacterized protein KVR01_013594 [Diaporthe batatas]KAG8156490.1 hypothetical protein KVR01_013594 [Diaporthe batatas]